MENKVINISAKSWKTALDFCEDLLKGVSAPDWHGKSIDALIDSIVYGGINGIEPPYVVRITDTDQLPTSIMEHVRLVKREIAKARIENKITTGVDVGVEFEIANDDVVH